MKKPVTIISNDWHIKPSNTESIINLIYQKIKLAIENNIDKVFVLGDVFQSRQAQPLSVLKCFEDVLDLFHENGIQLITIPGNHDKTNYESKDSFLDSFTYHPALFLMRNNDCIDIDSLNFTLIPFFENEVWFEEFEKSKSLIDKGFKQNILLSHIAINGSVNNDGSKVESKITPKHLKDFDAVFLGHYHNYQKVLGEIYHLPSLQQNNFGEDSNKGFTIIYDDGSFEIKKAKFKEYVTVKIDVDNLSKKEINELVKENDPKLNYVRLLFNGSEERLKSIKNDELKSFGYFVKTEQKDIIDSIKEVELGNIVQFDKSMIVDEFNQFCKNEGYLKEEIEIGTNYLNKILNQR